VQFKLGSFQKGRTTIVPALIGADLSALGLTIKEYHGKKKDHVVWFEQEGTRFLVVGLGPADKFKINKLRDALALGARAAVKEGETEVTVLLPEGTPLSTEQLVYATVESYKIGQYRFDKYKKNKEELTVKEVTVASLTEDLQGLEAAVAKGEAYAQGTIIARDLKNEPSNKMRPYDLVDYVQNLFQGTKTEIQIFKGDDLVKHSFVGLQAVGKGSSNPPAMIQVAFRNDPSKPHVALVGKGLTFDTGGISLKQGRDLSDMRMDMGGAAAVVGALYILTSLDAPVNVTMLIPTAENMPDGNSLLPGDVIEYPNGKSVHVGNTDAEGRLVLADALIHSGTLGAKTVVDIATLTGACAMALGSKFAGLWGSDDVVAGLEESAKLTGEYVWHMPTLEEYEDLFYSPIADLRNITEAPGAITAAMFLRHFSKPEQNWGHIDMAGVMEQRKSHAYGNEGATGYGARLLANWLLS